MIDLQVSGAGAGKTYGLAEIIIERLKALEHPKKIFALTYTNAAKEKIESEVINQNGSFPKNLKIETVHSFLLNEIVFPFSNYILGDIYNKSSIIYLGDNIRFKAIKIKLLKEQGVIHVDRVYGIAKQILDKKSSKNKTKKQKIKVDKILSILCECIDSIFIDETQDLDNDALKVFEILGFSELFIYMIGDPKQAIKWSKVFTDYIREAQGSESKFVRVLEMNNFTRRVPKNILKLSNRFCYEGQEQESLSEIDGVAKYIESCHKDFNGFMQEHITGDSIVCIDKKNSKYSTGSNVKYSFPFSIEEKIKITKHGRNSELVVRAAFRKFCHNAQTNHNKAITTLLRDFNISLIGREFAQLHELCRKIVSTSSEYNVSSIDSVKGLEANVCIFILTPNTYKYLTQEGLTEEQYFNKEWKKIYVALTRTKNELVLVLDHDLFNGVSIDDVKNSIERLGVKEY